MLEMGSQSYGKLTALAGVDLDVARVNGWLWSLGMKSTLIRCVNRLTEPDQGHLLGGQDVWLSARNCKFRHGLSFNS